MDWRAWMQRGQLPALIVAATVCDMVVPWRSVGRSLATLLGVLVIAALFLRLMISARQLRRAAHVEGVRRTRILEILLTLAATGLLGTKVLLWASGGAAGAVDRAYQQYAVAFAAVAALRLVVAEIRFRHLLSRLDLKPSQTVAAAFALTILGGGLLLSLPISVTSIERLDLLDALFTATSAVTVTGLAVYDPGSFLSPFGQVVLLLLIQVGGIGTLVATASLVLLAGRRMQLKKATELQEAMDVDTLGHVRSVVVTVVVTTFALEAAGAVMLHLSWRELPGASNPFFAVFHAVSAFCNAGFSLFPTSLVGIVDRPGPNLVICGLIVSGGIGFPVLRALGRVLPRLRRGNGERLSLHARLALASTALLIVAGAVALALLEWSRTLAPLAWPARLLAALFQSVTARTAGFNTLDIAAMGSPTLFLLMLLMFVGGSPGGTAGGIKTTTAATILLTLRAVLRGRERVEALRRTIPTEQVQKALAVVGVSVGLLATGTLLLLTVEEGDALKLAFEAVSAFATTGLSANVTPTLGSDGKLIVMLLMFVGRIGPMTLAFAVAARRRRVAVEFPEEKIMIG
jgi:trk system potassium uptake protein TrkH